MTRPEPGFRVDVIDYDGGREVLRAVRETVFVAEQGVPLEMEWDQDDPVSLHLVARDDNGEPIGTVRLTPSHAIGRMAVLRAWRGRGVGDALMAEVLRQARERRVPEVHLHAQVDAIGFYMRFGFVPEGPRFMEAGIEHQAMRRRLEGPTAIEGRDAAAAICAGLVARTRRELYIYSRALDPGLFDAPEVIDAFRRLGTRRQLVEVRILLQDASAAHRGRTPLIALAQRLSSVFAFREVSDPADRGYAPAYVANDTGGYYFRTLGNRFDGEANVEGSGRARQLADHFMPIWERARPCTEFRALEI